jgi:uncharacterized membrane protein (UPF0136 family)
VAVADANLGYPLAPAGVDAVVNRLPLEAGPRLLRRILRTIVPAGLLFAAFGLVGYGTSPSITVMILVSTIAGGALVVAGGQFQSEQRFGISLALNQSPNLILLLSALWVVLAGTRGAEPPLLVWTAGFVVAAAAGWWILFRERHGKPHRSVAFPWSEAFAIAGVSAALADARELSVISRLGWIAVAVAAVAAIAGARWGLPGVIYGVGLGWLVRSFTALYTTARHLRLPAAAMAVPS